MEKYVYVPLSPGSPSHISPVCPLPQFKLYSLLPLLSMPKNHCHWVEVLSVSLQNRKTLINSYLHSINKRGNPVNYYEIHDKLNTFFNF